MKASSVSEFMLERYKLEELSHEDQRIIREALVTDADLRARLKKLDESDRELRQQYPVLPVDVTALFKPGFLEQHSTSAKIRIALIAAAIALCIALPVLFFTRSGSKLKPGAGIPVASAPNDIPAVRAKGQTLTGSELFIYVKEEHDIILHNQTALEEGNTIQLAYTTPAGTDYYGVIFSIDGRSVVTTHYPYRKEQSSLLVSGKRTYLNEAYILDDAPDYEIFVFLVSAEPLNTELVLKDAQWIAQRSNSAEMIQEICTAVFEDCEVETVTLLKKSTDLPDGY